MRTLTAALWFAMAFLGGFGLFLVTRPAPVLHDLVMNLKGGHLIERCRQGGACTKSGPEVPPAHLRKTTPPDMDRA